MSDISTTFYTVIVHSVILSSFHADVLVLFMIFETFFRSTFHITILTFDCVFRFEASVRLAHPTRNFAFVKFPMIIMFEASGAEIIGAEKSCYAGDGVKVVVVD